MNGELPGIDPHIHKFQRDFIDELARYKGTVGFRYKLRQRPLTWAQVLTMRRNLLPTLELAPLPASHRRI